MRYPSKYRAKKTEVDGITFDSKKEAEYYLNLKILIAIGEVTDLELQKPFPIIVNGKKICTYKADFCFHQGGMTHVVDVKGFKTPVYRLKKKLVEALYRVVVEEV